MGRNENIKRRYIRYGICAVVLIAFVFPIEAVTLIKKNDSMLFDVTSCPAHIPGQLIVKLKKDTVFSKDTSVLALNKKYHAYAFEEVFKNAEDTILNNIYLLHVPIDFDIVPIVQEYIRCSDVVYAEPNGIVSLCNIPDDINFSKQWYLHNTGQIISGKTSGVIDVDIDAPEAWELEHGNSNVVIAIIDTGIDYTHPDLQSKIWNNTDEIPNNDIDDDGNGYVDDVNGWNFYNNTNDLKDYIGHGTMCAGVAGAATDNGIGIAGVSWNCTIMSIKETFLIAEINWTAIARGIRYAADNGADIISMSFGAPYPTFLVTDAVKYAYEKGVFLCASAGNINQPIRTYPAALPQVMGVGATNQNDRRCNPINWGHPLLGSTYGPWVDIAAPGHLIYTTIPIYFGDNESIPYAFGNGTSFSCPLVAGVAALLLSADSSLSPQEIKTLLCTNTDPYHSLHYIGTGRINAYKALADVLSDIEITLKGGLGVKMSITNTGPLDVVDVPWKIHVHDVFFHSINKTFNGTLDLKAGEGKVVSTGMFFGVGPLRIDVKVDIVEKTVDGRQWLFFSCIR